MSLSLPDVPEIPRSFVEWGTEDVVRWLSVLNLSQDYSKQFKSQCTVTAVRVCGGERMEDIVVTVGKWVMEAVDRATRVR